MPDSIDDLIPNAKQIRKEAALKEAKKADEYAAPGRRGRGREARPDRAAQQAVRQDRRGKDPARLDRHPARGTKRTDRSAGLPLPEFAVHRQGPRHQPDGKGLGEDADRHSEGNLPALDRLPASRAAIASAIRSSIFPAACPATSASPFPGATERRSATFAIDERIGMAKDDTAEKMKRKDYEKELEKLQVELCHLQEWVKAEEAQGHRPVRGPRRRRQGRHHQGAHRKGEPAGVPCRGPARAVRPAKIPAVHAALYRAISGRRRDRDLRPQLVQPRRRRICDGLL